jgi:hypothetical protein
MSDEALAAELKSVQSKRRGKLSTFFRRNVTPRLAAALAIWGVEARIATPLAILLIATIGQWPGALTMGGIMAVHSAVFLFLLDGENVMGEMRGWMQKKRWLRRYALPIAERKDRVGTVQRAVAIPGTIFLMGPFWRAVTYHLFRVPRAPAYGLSVTGAVLHSLLWTGLVMGTLWNFLLAPAVQNLF